MGIAFLEHFLKIRLHQFHAVRVASFFKHILSMFIHCLLTDEQRPAYQLRCLASRYVFQYFHFTFSETKTVVFN